MTEPTKPEPENDDDGYDDDDYDDYDDTGDADVIDAVEEPAQDGTDPVDLAWRLKNARNSIDFWKQRSYRRGEFMLWTLLYGVVVTLLLIAAVILSLSDADQHSIEIDKATRSAEQRVEAAEQRELEAFRACAAAGRSTTKE